MYDGNSPYNPERKPFSKKQLVFYLLRRQLKIAESIANELTNVMSCAITSQPINLLTFHH